MKLYLVQHGEATSKEENAARPLTETGKKNITQVANFLKKTGIEIACIWHSEKKRAIESAQIFGNLLSPKKGLLEKKGLSPNDPVEPIILNLSSQTKNIIIVGHLPFLQKCVSYCLTNSDRSSFINFKNGGVVCLELQENQTWEILFIIPPNII